MYLGFLTTHCPTNSEWNLRHFHILFPDMDLKWAMILISYKQYVVHILLCNTSIVI